MNREEIDDGIEGRSEQVQVRNLPIKICEPSSINLDYSTKIALDYNYILYSQTHLLPSSDFTIIPEGKTWITQNTSHCIILGMHGIGKTSLLESLNSELLQKSKTTADSSIPIIKQIEDLDFHSKTSLKQSIFCNSPTKSKKKTFLLIDGMANQVKTYQNFFKSFEKCYFTSSFKQYSMIPGFQVVKLEPFPISSLLDSGQVSLSLSQFLEFSQKMTEKNSQISEFCKFPKFCQYFINNFDELKSQKRVALYLSYLKTFIRKDLWKELELISMKIIDNDLWVFSFQDINGLGHGKFWRDLNEISLFKKSGPVDVSISELTCSDIENEYFESQDLFIKDSITEFSVTSDCNLLACTHVRLIECLAACYLFNKLEDLLSSSHKSNYIESQEFNKVFKSLFPDNFCFCKKYQEVVSLFAQICPETIFEGFIKFLISAGGIENLSLAERLLEENPGEYQHLVNCIESLKMNLVTKDFSQGLIHCSPTIRGICRKELSKYLDPSPLISTKLKQVLQNCSWSSLSSFTDLTDYLDSKDILSTLELGLNNLLSEIHQKQTYSTTSINYLLKLAVASIETPKSSNTTLTPSKIDLAPAEDSIKHDYSTQKILLSVNNTNIPQVLLQSIIKIEGLSLKPSIKLLLYLKTKKQKIRNCLIQRSKIFGFQKISKILSLLKSMNVKDEESFRFLMESYHEKGCKEVVIDCLRSMDKPWVRKTALWLLQGQVVDVIPAFAFCCESADVEVLEILLQYLDNSDENLSLSSAEALYYMLKPCIQIRSFPFLNLLRVLTEILTDKFELNKNFPEIAQKYLKVLMRIWKIIGDHKKIVSFACSIINYSSDLLISQIYKIVYKLKLNAKFLNILSSCFEDCKFGTDGKYSLKIAGFNFSWRNDLSVLRILTDKSTRFQEKHISKLLTSWDCIDSLKMLCNIEGLPYFSKIKNVLDHLKDSNEKAEMIQIFKKTLQSTFNDFLDYYERFGLEYVKGFILFDIEIEFVYEWILRFIFTCSDIEELILLSEIYAIRAKDVIVSRVIESTLMGFLPTHAVSVIKICLNLKLKSDEILLRLIPLFINKKIETSLFPSTVVSIVEKRSVKILVTLHKLVYFSSNSSGFTYSIHKAVNKIMQEIKIVNDLELHVFFESACKYNCSLYFEHIWKYIMSKVAINPRFYLSDACESFMKNSIAWDSKFSLKVCRIIGLMKHKSFSETCSQVLTKNYI